ncbi:MAG: hypothetical protein AAGE52_18035, partial [Myxococcota bacterium]
LLAVGPSGWRADQPFLDVNKIRLADIVSWSLHQYCLLVSSPVLRLARRQSHPIADVGAHWSLIHVNKVGLAYLSS